jgi:hypothetical protein
MKHSRLITTSSSIHPERLFRFAATATVPPTTNISTKNNSLNGTDRIHVQIGSNHHIVSSQPQQHFRTSTNPCDHGPSHHPQHVQTIDISTHHHRKHYDQLNSLEQAYTRRRIVEIWTTTCIVSNFGKSTRRSTTNTASSTTTTTALASINHKQISTSNRGDTAAVSPACTILVNPANSALSNVKRFTYFPRGGPVPTTNVTSMHKDWQPLGYVSSWGGMEVGDGMVYPIQAVDGVVAMLGGQSYDRICSYERIKVQVKEFLHHLHWISSDRVVVCPVGCAIYTDSGQDRLSREYDAIVHTVPPFYSYYIDGDPLQALLQCYRSSFEIAFHHVHCSSFPNKNTRCVAIPLLGAGVRGFPRDVAVDVAAQACIEWMNTVYSVSVEDRDCFSDCVVSFGLQDKSLAQQLGNCFVRHI